MLRKILLSIVAVLAVTVQLFGTVLGLAQTRLAKAQITGLVEDSLTGDGQTAEVEQLEVVRRVPLFVFRAVGHGVEAVQEHGAPPYLAQDGLQVEQGVIHC